MGAVGVEDARPCGAPGGAQFNPVDRKRRRAGRFFYGRDLPGARRRAEGREGRRVVRRAGRAERRCLLSCPRPALAGVGGALVERAVQGRMWVSLLAVSLAGPTVVGAVPDIRAGQEINAKRPWPVRDGADEWTPWRGGAAGVQGQGAAAIRKRPAKGVGPSTAALAVWWGGCGCDDGGGKDAASGRGEGMFSVA